MSGNWKNWAPPAEALVDPDVRRWIGLETSMTAAVSEAARHEIDVTVRRQEDGPLNPDEMPFFPEGGTATVREVCLSAVGEPLLIARTVFTSDILRTHPQILALGTRPLGSLLFAGPVPCPYTARQFSFIRDGDPLYPLIRWRHSGPVAGYWARRTLFLLFDAPLLVTEVLLPELVTRPDAGGDRGR